jgi:hypothetical protein
MKKQQLLLSSFAKLFSPNARITFYKKSFLVFVLALAALTLGRSQEAMAQWDWDWGDLPPGSIDGGSTNLVYVCSQGQGNNFLTPQESVQGATSDTFESTGTLSCTFGVDSSGVHRGVVQGTDPLCQYDVTWTGDLVSCANTSAGAVVTVKSTCDNPNVSGYLSCPHLTFNGNPVLDLLGISSKSECQRVFGRNANTLFAQATVVGQTCAAVLAHPTTAGLNFGGLTKTTTDLCHSDGGSFVDCITPSNVENESTSELPNLVQTQCVASPQTWNVDCANNKDNGNGRVCYVNGQAGFASFDPTKLNAATATLNGVPVDSKKSCIITDCNGDGILDFQCTFPTCSGGESVVLPVSPGLGELTMVTRFTGDISGVTCTTPVATSGTGS